MNEALPTPRESAYDKLARRIEEMADRRLTEHHQIRALHARTDSGRCRCCRQVYPCATMRVIDGQAVA